ncbi:DUF2306 domain-containing protein [Paenibacillus sp. NPDC057886]|uniref:DUF2306 domain-containing protein n=1 Tax=Paenibacillus sp. NPDC057886 TaxID=3346270 RepID=UPI0036AAD450
MNAKSAFRLLITAAAAFVFWTLLNRFVLDPDASVFLSYKTKLTRQMNLPVWLTMLNVHVIFACIAIAAGAINFANAKLRKYRKTHRILGYVYVVAVLAVCITSGYMAPFATGGKVVSVAFNLLNIIWIFITVNAYLHIRQGRVENHRHWMIRSYAFCFTNQMTHTLMLLFINALGMSYEVGYTASVIGAIIFLFLAAEWIIRRRKAGGSTVSFRR